MRSRGYGHACLLLLATMLASRVAVAQTWPAVKLPADAKVFDVGTQIVANGLPMKVQGMVSAQSPAALANWFRQAWGMPLVENTLADSVVLGRMVQSHYLTVQIPNKPQRDGSSRAVVSLVDLKEARNGTQRYRTDTARWQSRLPAGSKLASQMVSQDGTKLSQYLVFTNQHSEILNRERMKDLMREDAFSLERESVLPGQPTSTLLFKGAGKEALVTIRQGDDGRTTTVLNTIQTVEALP